MGRRTTQAIAEEGGGAERGCGTIDTLEVSRKPVLLRLPAEAAVDIPMYYH